MLEGRVQVNGETADSLPVLVQPGVDQIRVDGSRLKMPRRVYFLLNKPKGVISTNSDPQGRPKSSDLLHGVRERVYPVGRLDADSTGLMLLTNDGELADLLTHPRYGVEKTYRVIVRGHVGAEVLAKLRKGIWLADGRARSSGIQTLHVGRDRSVLEVRLREGRNRQVRRMLAGLDYKILSLKRTAIGNLRLTGLGPGRFRPMTTRELTALRRLLKRHTAAASAEE